MRLGGIPARTIGCSISRMSQMRVWMLFVGELRKPDHTEHVGRERQGIRGQLDRTLLPEQRPLLRRYAEQLAEHLVIVLAGVRRATTDLTGGVGQPRNDPRLQ